MRLSQLLRDLMKVYLDSPTDPPVVVEDPRDGGDYAGLKFYTTTVDGVVVQVVFTPDLEEESEY